MHAGSQLTALACEPKKAPSAKPMALVLASNQLVTTLLSTAELTQAPP